MWAGVRVDPLEMALLADHRRDPPAAFPSPTDHLAGPLHYSPEGTNPEIRALTRHKIISHVQDHDGGSQQNKNSWLFDPQTSVACPRTCSNVQFP
jgi:hypothetical protein